MKARIDELERNNGNDSVFGLNSDLDCYDGPGADAGSHEPDFMSILNEGINEAKKGPPLGTESAALVSKVFDNEPESNMVKSIIERYPEPENCDNLSGKAVNEEVFRSIDSQKKTKDFYLKKIQSTVATASIVNLRLIDELAGLKKQQQVNSDIANSLFKYTCDSTKLLAKCYADLSLFRKSLLRPHIQTSYQQLCTKRTFGPKLFGTDLAKEVKNIDEESKIMRQFSKTRPFANGQKHQGHFDSRQSKNWQTRGRGQFRPQYAQYRPNYSQFRGKSRAQRGRNKTFAAKPQQGNAAAQQ